MNRRRNARAQYRKQLTSYISYCGLCGVRLYWPAMMNPLDIYIWRGWYAAATIRTPDGFVKAFQGTVDHIIPLSQGGTNALTNLAGLCRPCHEFKDNQAEPGTRVCCVCHLQLGPTDFRRIHTDCLVERDRLTFSLGDAFKKA